MKTSPCLSCNHYLNAKFDNEEFNFCSMFRRDLKELSKNCNAWSRAYGETLQNMENYSWKIEGKRDSGFK